MMSQQDSVAKVYSDMILRLPPEERYKNLKGLGGNELFVEVVRIVPGLSDEFMWFEKRAELEATLIRKITVEEVQRLAARTRVSGPTHLVELLERWRPGDEFWQFGATPGDKGYALVREGQVVDFSVVEINCF